MALFTKIFLSGSTDGMGIKVVATATPGTAIHTAVSGSTSFDEIWLYAFNSDSVSRLLTIEFGDATAPDHNIVVAIPAKSGLVVVVPGLVLNNAATVKAFADYANVLTVSGFVNRIS